MKKGFGFPLTYEKLTDIQISFASNLAVNLSKIMIKAHAVQQNHKLGE